MQWPYEISADQWAALGSMLGGVAQVGLVVVGVLAAREWVRQERYKGVREIVEAHLTKTNHLLNVLQQLRISLDKPVPYNEIIERMNLLNTFDGILRELHFCTIRMQLYDEALADMMQRVNISLEAYRSRYIQYRNLVQQRAVLTNGDHAIEDLDVEIVALDKELFTLDTPLWNLFIHEQHILQSTAKKILWG